MIKQTCTLSAIGLRVKPGRMWEAKAFFEFLGYTEDTRINPLRFLSLREIANKINQLLVEDGGPVIMHNSGIAIYLSEDMDGAAGVENIPLDFEVDNAIELLRDLRSTECPVAIDVSKEIGGPGALLVSLRDVFYTPFLFKSKSVPPDIR